MMATAVAIRPAWWGPGLVIPLESPAFVGADFPAGAEGVAVEALLLKIAASGEPAGMPRSSGDFKKTKAQCKVN